MRIELRTKIETSPTGRKEDDFQPYLDTFLLDGATTPLGAVLVLPGGAYTHRAYHEGDPIARRFNELGFHAFVLQYRVAPYTYPAAQRDALRAVRMIRANAEAWRVNPNQLAVLGFSAGGHLAACVGLMYDRNEFAEHDSLDAFSAKPDALVLAYSVLSVTETYTKRDNHLDAGTMYRDENSADIEPWQMVGPETPPAFVWHTATDQAVPVECSMRFADAMWRNGRKCELHVFPEGPHGQGLWLGAPDASDWPREAAVFLKKSAAFTAAK